MRCAPLEPCSLGFQFHQSCPWDSEPRHVQHQNQQFLVFDWYPVTYFQSWHHDAQSFSNADNLTCILKNVTWLLTIISKNIGLLARHLPSSKIQCNLNHNFVGELPSPVLDQVLFQCSPSKIFDNNTARSSWKGAMAITSRIILWNLEVWSPHGSPNKL